MPDSKQLPHLLKLIDDNSEIVQEKVLEELSAYGPTLQRELARLNVLPETNRFREILDRLEEHNRRWLKNQWPLTLETGNEKKRLEEALSLLADFQNERNYPKKLTPLLDQLSTEFQTRTRKHDALFSQIRSRKALSNSLWRELDCTGNGYSAYYYGERDSGCWWRTSKRRIRTSRRR